MLSPLRYHHNATEYFRQQNKTWEFFSNQEQREEKLREFRNDLLKNTYKFDPGTDSALYQMANAAAEKLELKIPVHLYQAEHTDELNATIAYINNEAHIVFSGRILELLDDAEKLAILAHELSHVLLYTQLEGQVEVTDRIIRAIGNNGGSTPAHYESARLFRLYTEVFCDRGAYLVTGDYTPIISSLVKIATGLQKINVDSYIKQAEEIFSSDAQTKATGISHPENFIRARAIWLWHSQKTEAEQHIEQMIEGHVSLEELDLFKQQQLSRLTRQIILLLLQPEWMRTAQTISLSKQYFADLQPGETVNTTELAAQTATLHPTLQHYFGYVMYDFATADKSLEDTPLGYCFFLADELKMQKSFAEAVKKEMKLTEKKTATLKKQLLAEYHNQPTSSI